MRRHRGFSLIEMLIVILITMFLLGLLIPALGHARESARRVNCGSNMRQQLISVRLYMDADEDNAFMPMYIPAEIAGTTVAQGKTFECDNYRRKRTDSWNDSDLINWADLLVLRNMIDGPGAFDCPSEETVLPEGSRMDFTYGVNMYFYTYSIKGWGGASGDSGNQLGSPCEGYKADEPFGYYGPQLEHVVDPSQTIFLTDRDQGGKWAGTATWDWFRVRWPMERHKKYINVGMTDLSVKMASYGILFDTATPNGGFDEAIAGRPFEYAARDFLDGMGGGTLASYSSKSTSSPAFSLATPTVTIDGQNYSGWTQVFPMATVMPYWQPWAPQPYMPWK